MGANSCSELPEVPAQLLPCPALPCSGSWDAGWAGSQALHKHSSEQSLVPPALSCLPAAPQRDLFTAPALQQRCCSSETSFP